MKKTHVELWAFGSNGQLVATGLVTPAGVCGSLFKNFPCAYGESASPLSGMIKVDGNFGYGVTDKSELEWKLRAKRTYRAVRFQRVIVDF
ncbi:hypothetical protein ECBP5_0019 [Escherichia phage ECBP5]|uniref:Uncharacterized protein n=1 Tax=Escherichia phage ECBP5 TaxID=1498172 RepID=A0A0F6N5N3_9CAUD|nr:hypothetical protein ECBP5_0019 [Escherichia phage ECBP5]AID17673.1 hypothetical protein ECBP5_0019 [Escherichia phage ECBP5]